MRRLKHLPWKRIGLGAAVAIGLVAVIPVLRRAAVNASSQAIFLATSPFAPDVSNFNGLSQGTKVLAADGSLLVQLDGTQQLQPVKLSDLPPQVRNAVMAAEDSNFYHHPGVDAGALVRAAVHNAEGGSEQGGSTITQQLAKINYTNRKRSVFRKVKEVLYAAQLERHYTKDQLLERYVNEVYFGDGAYGIASAAKSYFDVTPDKLTAAQAALLAGKIRSPEGLNPRKDLAPVQQRRDQVLRNMKKHHWLTGDELQQALAEPVHLAPPATGSVGGNRAPYFVELVKREAAGIPALGSSPETQLFTGGYTVETTLDPRALDSATDAVRKQLGAPGDPAAAVVSVQPGDGAIRNLFGGLDFEHNQFDVATQGAKQPGSSFKPFVYLAALRDGVDPRSRLESSSPMKVPCNGTTVDVNNYEGEGHGQITIDEALSRSVNVVFTQLICRIGPDKVVKVAKDLQISEPINADPAIALGGLTKGVSPLEMAAAYATFAAKGVYAQPYSIARIKDRNGRVVYTHTVQTQQVVDPKRAGVLTAALESVVQSGTGRAAAIGRPVAGKTGTTEHYGNAWFVGYVPQLATAVWVGHVDSDVDMTDVHGAPVTGGRFPAAIFSATMKGTLAGQPVQELFTASPDDLHLHGLEPVRAPAGPPATARPAATTTSSSSSTTTTSSTEPPPADDTTTTSESSTTSAPSTTTTTAPAKHGTTTTTTSSSSTSTTAASAQSQSASTTTTSSP